MPKPTHLLRLLVLMALFVPVVASGIVMRHDRSDDAYRALGAKYPFCSLDLGGWGGGCTLIDKQWVVTAAHAAGRVEAGDQISVGGQKVKVVEVIVHPAFNRKNYRNDLALLRLARPIEGERVVALHVDRNEAGQRVVFVGRGYSGTGETGAKTRDKILRGAENLIEETTEHWLRFIFDAPPNGLELEGISGPGDSGGPAYLQAGGDLTLAGISSWQNLGDSEVEGVYGVVEFYTRVSSYVGWIRSTVEGRGTAKP